MFTSTELTAPIVLDGGLSTALEQSGVELTGSLWTARLLADEPDRIADAHRAYYRAGARVATTASYQASVDGLVAAGYDAGVARRLLVRSVTIAAAVRDEMRDEMREAQHDLFVAASVGPYGAMLADGSEYRGRYGVSSVQLRDFHGPRLELLAQAGPDLLAVETIPDIDEAQVIVELLDDLDVPAWVSYSVRGAATCAGQPLSDAFAVLTGHQSVVAAGVNCSDQADVLEAVTTAVTVTGLPAVAYPNRGGSWVSQTRRWEYDGPFDVSLVDAWVAAGARLVGGCCGTGPAEVAAIAQHLRSAYAPSAG